MSTTTEAFFDELSRQDYQPLLRRLTGAIRFDVGRAPHVRRWLVDIDRGAVTVSRRNRAADCTLRADEATFDAIVAGRDNAVAAVLRGAVDLDGDIQLALLFQRLIGAEAEKGART